MILRMLVTCPSCEAVVDTEALAETGWWPSDDPADFQTTVTFAKCVRCGRPLLIGQELYGTRYRDVDDDEGQEVWSDPFRIWPVEDRGLSMSVPKELREAFAEAQACFRAKAYTATALMCRKTIEAAAALQGATGRDLRSALLALQESGTLSQRLFEWADALRLTGNEAAHGLDLAVSREDAQDALNLAEALVDYLFVIQEKFEAFQSRRLARRPDTQP